MLFLLTSNFPSGSDVDAFKDLISDFSTWINRIGILVAFAGAIKFAIAIKDDDAKDKTLALLTMVAGFLISDAVTSLDLFAIPTNYTEFTANAHFHKLMVFMRKWVRRVGSFALFIGGVEFAFSMKNQDAGLKVTALKTMATGAMISALAVFLPDGI